MIRQKNSQTSLLLELGWNLQEKVRLIRRCSWTWIKFLLFELQRNLEILDNPLLKRGRSSWVKVETPKSRQCLKCWEWLELLRH
jgi:hypothetical protein